VLGCVLLLAVATLLVAGTSRHSYPRTRLAGLGALAVIALDVTMLTIVVLVGPALSWPMAGAITLSLARLVVTTRLLPRTLARS
jgi:hypothetical protein